MSTVLTVDTDISISNGGKGWVPALWIVDRNSRILAFPHLLSLNLFQVGSKVFIEFLTPLMTKFQLRGDILSKSYEKNWIFNGLGQEGDLEVSSSSAAKFR